MDDDDVVITDVDDDDSPQVAKMPLKNQDLSYLGRLVGELLSEYGWLLLFGTVLVVLLIQNLSKRRSRQSKRDSPPPEQQDADLVARRQEAMEASRMKMQEELNAKAALFKEKQKLQEEEKRKQKIEQWDSMQQGKSSRGVKLSQSTEEASSSSTGLKPKTDKRPLRSGDYNPLSGQGGGTCSWRPGRRGPSSGG